MEEKVIYVNMWSPSRYNDRYLDFESKYDVQAALFCGTTPKELKPVAGRICRFCKKDSTQTEFRDSAHLVPDGIGNTTHFSDVECHACNKLLGRYDNDLIKYLEPMRLFHWGTKKGGAYPVFNSPMKAAQVHIGALKDTEVIVFSRPDITKDTIAFNSETSTMNLSFPLNPYSPRNIYLSLLKIGLSIIGDDETGEYAAPYRYLIDNSVITEFNSLVTVYHLPIGSPLPPAAVLFRRKAGVKETPKHFLNLYVYNNIFTIPLLPNLSDLYFYNKPMTIPPPILILSYPDDVRIGMENLYFKGDEVVKNHIVNLSMEMNKEELKNGVRLDPKTGQMTPVDFYSHLSSMHDSSG